MKLELLYMCGLSGRLSTMVHVHAPILIQIRGQLLQLRSGP